MSRGEAGRRDIAAVEALRAARLQRGWSLTEVAARTNIRVEHLRALEANPRAWPDPAYPRAFARAYAVAVGADPSSLVDAFAAAAAPMHKDRQAEPQRSSKRWFWGLLAAGALLATAGVLLLLDGDTEKRVDRPEERSSGDRRERKSTSAGTRLGQLPTPLQEFGRPSEKPLATPTPGEALRLASPSGITFCVISDGELIVDDGLDAGGSVTVDGFSFDLIFPYGFDPEDLEASVGEDPIVIPDTQGASAVRIDPAAGRASTIPMPPAGCESVR